MKRIVLLPAVASLLFAGAAAAQSEPPVQVNLQGLNVTPNVAAKIRASAAEGETSLRRYLVGIRTQERLAYEDVARPGPQAAERYVLASLKPEVRRHAKEWKYPVQ